jgi:hypothetical protein
MDYMLCRHRVSDYGLWRKVFDSHAEAQRQAGLHILHVLRDADDFNLVVFLFRIDDPAKAKSFTETPEAEDAGRESGVIGEVEISFLSD